MTSDGYRLTLESAVRDAKEETRREDAGRLREKDREIAVLERLVKELKRHIVEQDEQIARLEAILREY